MSHAYQYNAEYAKEADSGNMQITVSGPYVGMITLAEDVKSPKGTQGIELSFKTATGQFANYLTMWTRNAEGKSIFGEKQLNALMACMKIQGITPQQMVVKKWDFDQKKEVDTQVIAYPELMSKPIGLVLQREQYYNKKSEIKDKMNLFNFFDPSTRKTALELIENTEPKKLDSILSSLKDKLIDPTQTQPIRESENPADGLGSTTGFDDDLAF